MNYKHTVKLVAFVLLFELACCACPSGYTHRFGSKCYFVKDFWGNRAQNVDFCSRSGGTLASIRSEAENKFLVRILSKSQSYWIGLRRTFDSDAPFAWLDGSPVNYTNWYSSEPNDFSFSNWGAYIYAGDGYWRDESAKTSYYQLCQFIDDGSTKLEVDKRVFDELVNHAKAQEILTRELTEMVKHAIGRVNDVTTAVSLNLTAALEKMSSIDQRISELERSNRVQTLNLSEQVNEATGRVKDVSAIVAQKLTSVLEKLSAIDCRICSVETSNKTSSAYP